MEPADLQEWRSVMGFDENDAARALKISVSQLREHEQPDLDGKRTRQLPIQLAHACSAIFLSSVLAKHGTGLFQERE